MAIKPDYYTNAFEEAKNSANARVSAARTAANTATPIKPTVNDTTLKTGRMSKLAKGLASPIGVSTQIASDVLNNPMVAQGRDDAIKGLIQKSGLTPKAPMPSPAQGQQSSTGKPIDTSFYLNNVLPQTGAMSNLKPTARAFDGEKLTKLDGTVVDLPEYIKNDLLTRDISEYPSDVRQHITNIRNPQSKASIPSLRQMADNQQTGDMQGQPEPKYVSGGLQPTLANPIAGAYQQQVAKSNASDKAHPEQTFQNGDAGFDYKREANGTLAIRNQNGTGYGTMDFGSKAENDRMAAKFKDGKGSASFMDLSGMPSYQERPQTQQVPQLAPQFQQAPDYAGAIEDTLYQLQRASGGRGFDEMIANKHKRKTLEAQLSVLQGQQKQGDEVAYGNNKLSLEQQQAQQKALFDQQRASADDFQNQLRNGLDLAQFSYGRERDKAADTSATEKAEAESAYKNRMLALEESKLNSNEYGVDVDPVTGKKTIFAKKGPAADQAAKAQRQESDNQTMSSNALDIINNPAGKDPALIQKAKAWLETGYGKQWLQSQNNS